MKKVLTIEDLKRVEKEKKLDRMTDLYARELAIAMSSTEWNGEFDAFDIEFSRKYGK